MYKKIVIVLALLLFPNFTNAALLPDGATVAVMDFGTHKGAATSDISLASAEGASSDYVIERLVEDGRLTVMERSIMQEKLNKEKLKTTGIIDPDTAKRIGEILGVSYIIYGNVSDVTVSGTGTATIVGGVSLLNVKSHIIARIMDVKTGTIISASKGEGKSTSSLTSVGAPEAGVISVGVHKVSQVAVHNALKKAAYNAVDIMLMRIYGDKQKRR
ncbi:MAG: hypothetical protein IKN12_01710 [Selenomonadaceae bacterium]|nr:hypothetical protein [Selenomonadaceae bacterium]